jgi:hypothetical protein
MSLSEDTTGFSRVVLQFLPTPEARHVQTPPASALRSLNFGPFLMLGKMAEIEYSTRLKSVVSAFK